eukprot:TRINITY_DN12680_c0_g1_i1.p1 TRINITY_DN12680_c0_g1~~TRINITY_DN12680_c0_g1_i1.p1  ORF type:complete len:266 (-),score=35.73 TRINITY_DN12680_c0_g1_i1:194-991(-)
MLNTLSIDSLTIDKLRENDILTIKDYLTALPKKLRIIHEHTPMKEIELRSIITNYLDINCVEKKNVNSFIFSTGFEDFDNLINKLHTINKYLFIQNIFFSESRVYLKILFSIIFQVVEQSQSCLIIDFNGLFNINSIYHELSLQNNFDPTNLSKIRILPASNYYELKQIYHFQPVPLIIVNSIDLIFKGYDSSENTDILQFLCSLADIWNSCLIFTAQYKKSGLLSECFFDFQVEFSLMNEDTLKLTLMDCPNTQKLGETCKVSI